MPGTWKRLKSFLKQNPFPIAPKGIKILTMEEEPALPYLGERASIPERIFAKELLRRGIPFEAQVPVAGGVGQPGGALVDFKLTSLHAWVRVQGEYYHPNKTREAQQALLLGTPTWRVIDIWVWDVLHRLDWVMNQVLWQGV